MLSLRTANRSDLGFMWEVQWVTLGEYVERDTGRDQAAQKAHFDEHFDYRRCQIVSTGGIDVGFMSHEVKEDHVYLGNIVLLPPFQRQGLGSTLVQIVRDEASALQLPVRLRVLLSNPARSFYERLGFSIETVTKTHVYMGE